MHQRKRELHHLFVTHQNTPTPPSKVPAYLQRPLFVKRSFRPGPHCMCSLKRQSVRSTIVYRYCTHLFSR